MAAPHAQSVQGTLARNNEPAPAAATESHASTVQLLVGRSTVISVGQPITRVSLTTPNIADAMVTSPQQLLLHGKAPGTISLFVWDRGGGISRYEVIVQRDLSELSARLKQLFPGENITVASNGKDVVLSGHGIGQVHDGQGRGSRGRLRREERGRRQPAETAGGHGLAAGAPARAVRGSEPQRPDRARRLALRRRHKDGRFGRSTTQQFSAPFFDQQQPMLGKSLVFSDYLNLFLFDAEERARRRPSGRCRRRGCSRASPNPI